MTRDEQVGPIELGTARCDPVFNSRGQQLSSRSLKLKPMSKQFGSQFQGIQGWTRHDRKILFHNFFFLSNNPKKKYQCFFVCFTASAQFLGCYLMSKMTCTNLRCPSDGLMISSYLGIEEEGEDGGKLINPTIAVFINTTPSSSQREERQRLQSTLFFRRPLLLGGTDTGEERMKKRNWRVTGFLSEGRDHILLSPRESLLN